MCRTGAPLCPFARDKVCRCDLKFGDHQVTRNFLSKTVIGALLIALGGCMGWNVPGAKDTTGRNPEVAEIPTQSETVRGEEDPPIVTLELGEALHEHRLTASDELPGNIVVPTTNLSAVPITAALQAVLSGTDVSISWDTGTLGDRLVTVMNLSGPLPKVVDKICAAAKVFCSYRNGSIELQDKDTFVVAMPPVAHSVSAGGTGGGGGGGGGTNSMVETISHLVNGKVQLDDQGGNVIYTTDVEGESRVSRYLEQLRNGRPLIVMQLYIWEVTLDKENAAGINWTKFQIPAIGSPLAKLGLSATSSFTSPNAQSGSVSVGAVTTGKLNTNSLISFLSTQGRVQTISSPQMTFVSGTTAELKIGGKQRYISQVGQLVGTTNTSGTTNPSTNTGVGSNTVSTDSIDTGLNIAMAGTYENGVVFANLDMALTGISGLNPTTSNGVTIDLPSTTDEKINTVIRVRPGDNLVMAGLVTSKDNNTRQGIPLGSDFSLDTYGDNTLQNHELVVVVKPSVILFSDKLAVEETKKKETSKPLPEEAVLIDKNGSQPVAMPKEMPLVMTAPTPPAPPMPLSPYQDNGAVVDQRLMQRGFSHAFDDLLQPAPTSPTVKEGAL